jgi:hypothetical protein
MQKNFIPLSWRWRAVVSTPVYFIYHWEHNNLNRSFWEDQFFTSLISAVSFKRNISSSSTSSFSYSSSSSHLSALPVWSHSKLIPLSLTVNQSITSYTEKCLPKGYHLALVERLSNLEWPRRLCWERLGCQPVKKKRDEAKNKSGKMMLCSHREGSSSKGRIHGYKSPASLKAEKLQTSRQTSALLLSLR